MSTVVPVDEVAYETPASTNGSVADDEADQDVKVKIADDVDGPVVYGVDGTETAPHKEPADKPYPGMDKEDLLRFSETVFWQRFRIVSILLFWGAWLALLGAVIGLTIVAPRCDKQPEPEWWQKAVVYQIYVRSFLDTDGNGIGDIKGVTEKLDYLQSLHVNAVLLSSIYESRDDTSNPDQLPDYGYEITNHTLISSEYGTMSDLAHLIEVAHNKSMAVLMDFVPNYTGKEHPWFQSSVTDPSYTNPHWNYYVWADCDATTPTPPNNWMSVYNGSAWAPEAGRGDYCYLHQFLDRQPELNLRSAAVQNELEEILRHWLDFGVDGFRISSTKFLVENADLTNEPEVPGCLDPTDYRCLQHIHTTSQPETIDLIKRWRLILDEYTQRNKSRPRILLTDADVLTNEEGLTYHGSFGEGADLPINYIWSRYTPQSVTQLYYSTRHWIDSTNFMTHDNTAMCWLVGDQDRMRSVSLAGNNVNVSLALTVLTLTLPGTAVVYYGSEIGMTNWINSSKPSQDPVGKDDLSLSRDAVRTPMQWTNDTNANFTQANQAWMDVNPNYMDINVRTEEEDSDSVLSKFRQLAALRSDYPSLQYGATHFVNVSSHTQLIVYVREHEGNDRILVAINLSGQLIQDVDLTRAQSPFKIKNSADVILLTGWHEFLRVDGSVNLRSLRLRPSAALVAKWGYERP